MSEWRFSAAHAGPVVATPEWEEMVRLEQELEKATARIRELEAELFEWRGCPTCHTDHGPNSTCPPHEVRPTGLDSAGWQYGLWRGRTRAAKLRAEKAEAERDEALAEAVALRLALEQTLDWFTTENVGIFEAVYGELDETDVIDNAKKCLSGEATDAALAEVARLKETMAKLKALPEKPVFESILNAEHMERDRKRDEALRKISKQACDCGLFSQHEVSCPTSIAREVLKEG